MIGAAEAFALRGQISGTVNIQGHVSVEQLPEFQAIFDSLVPVAFTIQVGDGSGATDAGLYSGLLVLGTFTLTATADGEWDYTADGQTSGTTTYAPGTP